MDIKKILIGLIILKLLIYILKRLFDQNRPNGKKYGMPSFTGAYTGFLLTYLIKNSKLNLNLISLSIIFIIVNYTLKLSTYEHNLKQLIIGTILGCFIGIIL